MRFREIKKPIKVSYKKKEAAEKKAAYEAAKRNGWPIIIEKDGVYQELMKLTPDGYPLYYATESNVVAARSTRANFLNSGGGEFRIVFGWSKYGSKSLGWWFS